MDICDLREDVITSDEPVQRLYEKKRVELNNKSVNKSQKFPAYEGVKHFLYSARNKSAGVSKTVFSKANEVEVPLKFQDFLLADYQNLEENTRIIVFCSKESRDIIPNIKEYFVDGTFFSCPSPFVQMYSFHGDINSTITNTNAKPLIFALMTDRKEHSYYILLSLIKSQIPQWEPIKVHCDYEKGAINAFLKVFPNIIVKGCYYHWTRNIWRKAKSLGNTKTKAERRIVGLTAVLPLLPSENIREGFEYVKSECAVGSRMGKFINYVERFWFRVYSPEIFSVFGERHRTNNILEGYHSKLNKLVNKNTVTVMRLLNVLQYIHNLKAEPKKRKRADINNDDLIVNIQLQFLNGEISLGHALEKFR